VDELGHEAADVEEVARVDVAPGLVRIAARVDGLPLHSPDSTPIVNFR